MILLSIEEAAFNWMATHVPHLLFLLIVICLACWITYQTTKFVGRFDKTEAQCNDLRNNYIPDLHVKFKGIDNKLGTIVLTMSKIQTYLVVEKGLNNNLFEAKSPLELTENGKKILTDVGGQEYIDKNLQALILDLEARAPKTGLDVQSFAGLVLTEKTTDEGFTHIKNYIFQNPVLALTPDKKFNLDLSMVLQIMGIYLRNKYFEKYPDLKKDL